MIDANTETLVTLYEACERLPGKPCYSTIQRWRARAINPLEIIKYGGRVYTSLEALERFARKCTDPSA